MRVYVVACMNVCISAYLHVLMVLSFISFTTHTHTHREQRAAWQRARLRGWVLKQEGWHGHASGTESKEGKRWEREGEREAGFCVQLTAPVRALLNPPLLSSEHPGTRSGAKQPAHSRTLFPGECVWRAHLLCRLVPFPPRRPETVLRCATDVKLLPCEWQRG